MKNYKKITVPLLAAALCLLHPAQTQAQIPIINIITTAIKKVIVAIDIKVQQLQNKTIRLQQAEQRLENSKTMTSLKDINGWLGKEKDLFNKYYNELQQVRKVIAGYSEIKQIISQQARLVDEYHKAWTLFRQDKNFSASEISYMTSVYGGMLDQSAQHITELTATVTSFSSQMNDGERLERIKKIAASMQQSLNDLRSFNTSAVRLSMQRGTEKGNLLEVKKLYGITQ